MLRNLVAVTGALALIAPALGQEHAYQYDDPRGSMWTDDPAPPGEGSYSEYAAEPSASSVDVSVDLAAPGAAVSLDTFQDGLAPYGQWVTMPGYGQVWRPTHVAAGWRPYYYGRWEWTDEGWLWVSDEPWGWAAYHYGRWARDPYQGWFWVPGYQWAPAWVTWRYSPDYIGWAPLGPGFSVYVTSYPVVYDWWTFVPCRRFAGVPVYSAAFTGGHVRGIFHATQPAPPRAAVYGATAPAWGGPARPFVEHRVGRPIAPVRLQPVASPSAIASAARPGVVPVYRPEARPGAFRGSPVRAPAPVTTSRGWEGGVPPRPPAAAAAPAAPNARPSPHAVPRSGSAWGGAAAAPAAPRPFVGAAPSTARAAPIAPQNGAVAPVHPQGGVAPPRPQGNAFIAPRPQVSAPPAHGGGVAPAPAPAPAPAAGGGHPSAPAAAGGHGNQGGVGHAPHRR